MLIYVYHLVMLKKTPPVQPTKASDDDWNRVSR